MVLAVGSNLGDRMEHLARGVEALERSLEIEGVSSVYESDPVGHEDQPRFLNAAIVARTGLTPRELLLLCQKVEVAGGRTREFPNAPRTLDVDIVFVGQAVMDRPGLVVPHPRWRERAFVLAPLAEVAPAWMDPVSGRPVQEIWSETKDELPPASPVAPPEAIWRTCE